MFEGQPTYRERNQRQIEARMTKLCARHRRELLELLGSPPDLNRVPPEFWQKVRDETAMTLAAALLLIWMAESLEQGIDYQDFEDRGSIWANERAAWVGERYADWSEREVLRRLSRYSPDELAAMSRAQLEDEIRPLFGPQRAARVAMMETNQAITKSRIVIGSEGDEDVDFIWELGECNHCGWCVLVQGFGREVWAPFSDGPPAHWGCCCWLRRIVGWADNAGAPSYSELLDAAQEVGLFIPTGSAIL